MTNTFHGKLWVRLTCQHVSRWSKFYHYRVYRPGVQRVAVFQALWKLREYPNHQGCNCLWWWEDRDNIHPCPRASIVFLVMKSYILVLGQALYFCDEVEASLLCPNQMRANGVIVDDIPIHLLHNNASTHSLIFPEDEVTIPLKLNGCFSYIPTRTPTTNEIEKCKWLILMNDMPWEPNLIPSQDLEDAAITNLERVHYGDRNISSISGGTVNNLQEISDMWWYQGQSDHKLCLPSQPAVNNVCWYPTSYPGVGPLVKLLRVNP